MNITQENAGDTIILHCSGKIDFIDEKTLLEKTQAIMKEELLTLAIDLAGVEVLDSRGIASLISILNICVEHNVEMVIYGMQNRVVTILERVFPSGKVEILSTEEFNRIYI